MSKCPGCGAEFAEYIGPVHKYFGRHVDQTQSFDLGIAVVGLTPLVGYFALRLFWDKPASPADS